MGTRYNSHERNHALPQVADKTMLPLRMVGDRARKILERQTADQEFKASPDKKRGKALHFWTEGLSSMNVSRKANLLPLLVSCFAFIVQNREQTASNVASGIIFAKPSAIDQIA
jgi:hypothetical protein